MSGNINYNVSNKVISIFPAIDRNTFVPINKELSKSNLNVPKNKTIITFVGRLSPEKGVYAKEMLKTIPPKRMFYNAWKDSINLIVQYTKSKVAAYSQAL